MTHIEWRRQFQDQGFLVFRKAFDLSTMREVVEHVEMLRRRHPEVASDRFAHAHLFEDDFWKRFARDDRLVNRAAAFLGNAMLVVDMYVLGKPPVSGPPVDWHQDAFDFPRWLPPKDLVGLWTAFETSTAQNGGLRVVPGSHRPPVLHPHGRAAPPFYPRQPAMTDRTKIDESAAMDLDLEAGDVALINAYLLHASHENRSPRTRSAAIVWYSPPVAWLGGRFPAFPVRATDASAGRRP